MKRFFGLSITLIFLLSGCQKKPLLFDNTQAEQEAEIILPATAEKETAFPLKGFWIGNADFEPYPELVSLSFDSIPLVRLFYRGIELHQPDSIGFNSEEDELFFRVDHYPFKGEFRGKVEEDRIEGTFYTDDKPFPCSFIQMETLGLEQLQHLLGYFQFGDSQIVMIDPFVIDMDRAALSLQDFYTGKKRIAYPHSLTKYVAGSRMLDTYPPELILEATFDNDQMTSLLLQDLGESRKKVEGSRLIDLDDQLDIRAKNGDVELAGTIIFPSEGEAPYPLIIFVPGAGEQYRGNLLDDYIDVLPYLGIATLIYDKRGCGQSTGDRLSASFEDLANDALALLQEAKKSGKVDQKSIGVVGFDQAGYALPIMLEKDKSIQYASLLSGNMTSIKDQEFFASKWRMKADGYDQEAIDDVQSYQSKMFEYLEGKLDSVTFFQASKAMENKPWAKYITLADNAEFMNWWKANHSFSPSDQFSGIDVPLMLVYGENDLLIDVPKNLEVIESLKKNLHPESQTLVLPSANHLLLLGETRGDVQLSEIRGYAPDFFPAFYKWMLRQAFKSDKTKK